MTLNRIYQFIGNLEEMLKSYDSISPESELTRQLKIVTDRISAIIGRINKQRIKDKEDAAMKYISTLIKIYADIFDAERKDTEVLLDIQNLTLKFLKIDGDSDFLWEIGSGHNYMSYHIATMLALHEYFLKLKEKNKIPSFIIFDQPSQVYFPELTDDSKLNDEDLVRVNRIFTAISKFSNRVKSKTQVIVLEHAGEKSWSDLDNVKLIKRWRKDEKDTALIPSDWI